MNFLQIGAFSYGRKRNYIFACATNGVGHFENKERLGKVYGTMPHNTLFAVLLFVPNTRSTNLLLQLKLHMNWSVSADIIVM